MARFREEDFADDGSASDDVGASADEREMREARGGRRGAGAKADSRFALSGGDWEDDDDNDDDDDQDGEDHSGADDSGDEDPDADGDDDASGDEGAEGDGGADDAGDGGDGDDGDGDGDEEEGDGDDDDGDEDVDERDADGNSAIRLPKSAKPLTLSALKKYQDRVDKTGVVYLSRIPPFMKPSKVRSLLSRYGELGRIYLNPEDAKTTARRKKYKHNRRQNYTEGWVEFLDKGVAKRTAALLNNNIMGGKKRSYYHDDIWNIRYLPRFKWNHLTEQLAYELKVKEQRLRAEMAQAKREEKIYVQNVAKAKMVEAMLAKRGKKRAAADDDAGAGAGAAAAAAGKAPAAKTAAPSSMAPQASMEAATAEIRRRFKQRRVVDSHAASGRPAKDKEAKTAAVLSKLFS
ncbi:RNA-binding ATPase activator esf2 [Polyrhizophydium stewartii]|uniref:RNA-binding ATPase activator esf2 n=1 Tax=Polyrhizophydium stewartii TaxID=2732419 RepID=A0ABR4N9U7_9FUNG|nr:RNA-binding ATPase activator esf2 [Polyrhizophydium stewartii]